MPYIRDSFWRGREFTSLAQMQAEAVRWCTAGGRAAGLPAAGRRGPGRCVRRGGEGRAGGAAGVPVRAGAVVAVQVGPDIHVKVGRTLYSVPWRHIGKTLDARSTATMVQLFLGGDLVKTHARKEQGKQTDLADYPPEKIAFHMRTPAWCRKKAAQIGPACDALIGGLLEDNAALPAPRRPGRAAPGRPAPARPPRGRLRQSHRRR